MILQLHSPEAMGNAEIARAMQEELLKVHESEQAWGLTEGLLQHSVCLTGITLLDASVLPGVRISQNAVVRFFGAHNAHIKISRFWETLPEELRPALLSQTLRLTSEAASPASPYAGDNNVVLRKLFSSLASLILRLTPREWPNPLLQVLTTLAGHGVPKSTIFEWLETAIRDVQRGALVEPRKSQMVSAMSAEVSIVLETVKDSLQSPQADGREKIAAFKCLEAWIEWGLTGDEITGLVPILLPMLDSPFLPPTAAVLVEILTTSVFKDGKACKILTEPILQWFSGRGLAIIRKASNEQDADSEDVNSLAKLVAALVEHSTEWMIKRIEEHNVQAFLAGLLELTSWPGVAGRDENISETTLGHYSAIQEALTDDQEGVPVSSWTIAEAFFAQVVERVRNKVKWPMENDALSQEEVGIFETYRRDAGEVMITA